MTHSTYGYRYRQARRLILGPSGGGLLLSDVPCHWCGAIATTADHEPPVAEAGWHLNLLPACGPCNSRRGADLRNGKRAQAPPSPIWGDG